MLMTTANPMAARKSRGSIQELHITKRMAITMARAAPMIHRGISLVLVSLFLKIME